MKPHSWAFETRGFKDGVAGEWHLCSGCQKRVFFPDGASDFRKGLIAIGAWVDDVSVLSRAERDSRVVRDSVSEKGYHAVLADDCDEARRFNVEHVMLA